MGCTLGERLLSCTGKKTGVKGLQLKERKLLVQAIGFEHVLTPADLEAGSVGKARGQEERRPRCPLVLLPATLLLIAGAFDPTPTVS